ncbi:MAG: hypothetical protein IPK71_20480 [Myxococcales bacterium]|nr:hypothetical protein [Myxococcales bacterium]
MKLSRTFGFLAAAHLCLFAAGCSAETSEPTEDTTDVAITSNDGKLFDFTFDAEVVASSSAEARDAIVAQLAYVQGALTTHVGGNGQVGLVEVGGLTEAAADAGKKRIAYKAKLPVIWPKSVATPRTYELVLPRDVTALDRFNRTYDGTCGKNEYGVDTFWHDFNPKASGCTPAAADVVRAPVTVTRSANATTNKYPEYDKMLEDGAIDVVGVFGIISSDTPQDEGAREMENVIEKTMGTLTGATRKDAGRSATVVKSSEVTGKATVGGREITVSFRAVLVNEVAAAGADFDAIYGPASEKADLIVYSGHSGLGKNVNSLAERTKVAKGKYQVLYLNGCQTFGYLGRALHDKKIAVNGATDPKGTKFLDVVANALPAYGDDGATGLDLYRAILDQARPRSYNDLLRGFSRIHLVAVFGEDDNTFAPR